jgi:prepilin-type N-terminal cleavage/methylation domain-containing protein
MSLLRSVTTSTRLPRAARGYTLAEVLMVVVILSVLLAAGVPQLADFSRQQRVKTASFELFSTLVHARSEAITRNGQVTVTPTGGAWINGWTVTGPGGTVIRRQEAVPAIAITVRKPVPTRWCSPKAAGSMPPRARSSRSRRPARTSCTAASGSI